MSKPLDIEQPEALLDYLRTQGHISNSDRPQIRVLAGGVSNRTVWIRLPDGQTWVLKQALEKLRVREAWYSDPVRIHREAAGLRWLIQLLPAGTIPELIFEDSAVHVLAMQAVPEPHANWKTLLLAGQIELDQVRQFGQLLGLMHRRAFERQAQVAIDFDDRTFFETLRIEPYYVHTYKVCAEATAFITDLIEETRHTRLTLTHGDYSPKNILVYQGRLILLDHEVIHFGDPAFDFGFSLTHLLSKAHHLRPFRDAFVVAANEHWRAYGQALGELPWTASLEARAVRHTLACLLARVIGKSPLEYLGEDERLVQQQCVVRLMTRAPTTIADLIARFVEGLPQ